MQITLNYVAFEISLLSTLRQRFKLLKFCLADISKTSARDIRKAISHRSVKCVTIKFCELKAISGNLWK